MGTVRLVCRHRAGIADMRFLLVLALAASTRGDATADPAFFYSTGGVPVPLAAQAPLTYAHVPLTYTAPTSYILPAGCQNDQGSAVPCNLNGAPLAVAPVAAQAAPQEGGVEVSKREAGPEPTAEADPEADPWLYYSSYGYPYSYGYSYAPLAYSGYYGGYYPYTYSHYYGYYGRKKRDAEAEPEADPEADPWYYYSGFAPYSYAYAAPYTYVLGGCRNYLGSIVPCAGK